MSQKSITRTLFSLLESVDMFGIPIRFHIHEQPAFRTAFSGFLSIALTVGLLSYAIMVIVDALYYSNIQFLATATQSQSKFLSLDSSNFIMAVKVPEIMDSKHRALYSVNFQYITATTGGATVAQPLGVMNCSQGYLQIHESEIQTNELSSMLCPITTDYHIEKDDKQYIQIVVKKCENVTGSPITCAPPEEIEAFFNSKSSNQPLQVYVHLTYNFLDLLSLEPNVRHLKKIPLKLPGGPLGYQTDLFLKEEVVATENNVLNQFKRGIIANSTISIAEKTSDQIVYSNDGSFLEVNIKKSDVDTRYARSFTKLGEILATLGGLAKVAMIVMSLVAIPYNEFFYNLALSNEIYEFESRPKLFYKKTMKNVKKGVKRSITFSELALHGAQSVDLAGSGSRTDTPNRWLVHKEKVNKYHPFFESLRMRHQRLSYTAKEIFKRMFCWFKGRNLKIKDDLFSQAKKHLRKDVDIITVLKKLQDIDKLKQLIFSRNQIEVFNYKRPLRIEYFGHFKLLNQIPMISKRSRASVVSGVDPKTSLYLPEKSLETIDQFKALFESYKTLKDNATSTDEKLIQMLGPELLSIFQKLEEDYQNEMAVIAEKSGNFTKVAGLDSDGMNASGGSKVKEYPDSEKTAKVRFTEEDGSAKSYFKRRSSVPAPDTFSESNNGYPIINLQELKELRQPPDKDETEETARSTGISKIPTSIMFSQIKR